MRISGMRVTEEEWTKAKNIARQLEHVDANELLVRADEYTNEHPDVARVDALDAIKWRYLEAEPPLDIHQAQSTVFVQFLDTRRRPASWSKPYTFKTDLQLEPYERVVCDTSNGLQVGRVIPGNPRALNKHLKATKWIVDKVNKHNIKKYTSKYMTEQEARATYEELIRRLNKYSDKQPLHVAYKLSTRTMDTTEEGTEIKHLLGQLEEYANQLGIILTDDVLRTL